MLLFEECTIHAGEGRWLEGVDLVVRRGERFGVVVTERTVRSAIVALLTGEAVPERGRVRVDGLDPVADADLLHGRVRVLPCDDRAPVHGVQADVLVVVAPCCVPADVDAVLARPDRHRTRVTVLLVTDDPAVAERHCDRIEHLS